MKIWMLWTLAVLITIGAAYYQRVTGPTYPNKVKFEIFDSEEQFTFPRSFAGEKDCKLAFAIKDPSAQGKIYFKRFPSDDEWTVLEMTRTNDTLYGYLPNQPPAGKLAYYIELDTKFGVVNVEKEKPVIIRFRGDVPAWIFIPHVILMFVAMFFSNIAGLFAIAKKKMFRLWANISFILIAIGGMIFGPLMQKEAFGEYWTGVPNGWDLTDNKTLIAFIFWIAAFVLNIKKPRPVWVIVASVVTLVIFSIPHSMFGSEFDYESGKVVTGMVHLVMGYGL